ncbi:protein FAM180A [Bombina bombina]|uniref:protein FAM180A n=1 Tax=Bombina bombina TaxID=8345 RepID=UPI00235A604D|nr:protein FAM180A [Bombina bombina]
MFLESCLVLLLFNYVEANFTTKWQRVPFFPTAHRVRRSSAELLNPVLQSSLKEVELLYEFLLSGVKIDQENRLTLQDPELSSLSKATIFDVVCNDVIPKSIGEIRRLGDMLSHVPGPLRNEDFERTLLTMAYSAYKTSNSESIHQQKVWIDSLIELFKALRRDLMFPYNKQSRH